MGMWKLSCLVARDSKSGKWEVVDGPVQGKSSKHNEDLKKLNTANGKKGSKQYDCGAVMAGVVKRRKFDEPSVVAPVRESEVTA